MTRARVRWASAVGVCTLALVVITACSSSKKASTGSSSTPASNPTSSAATAPTGSSGAGGAGGAAADAATTAAITNTFVTLFNGAAPISQRLALLQNASAFQSALAAQANSPLITQTSATVSKVALTSAKQANVTYTLLFSGVQTVTNQIGVAVLDGNTWKVSAATFCGLLTAAGAAPAACTQASITALPS